MRLAPEGKPILVVAAILGLLGTAVADVWLRGYLQWVIVLSFLPLMYSLWFFRDPERRPPSLPNAVVAPADGKIIELKADVKTSKDDESRYKISIFMSPFSVHVNRIPISGTIAMLQYNKGRFLTAFHKKASLLNEQQAIEIETHLGGVGCIQIAGWLARRIACHLHVGQRVRTGDRFGMIRFGSRLDVYIPQNCELRVNFGQKVTAGKTVIGVLHEKN